MARQVVRGRRSRSGSAAPARGQGKLGCVLWLAVLAVFVLIAVKAVPVKVASAQLYDYMEDQARYAGNTGTEVLRRRIVERAESLDLPVRPQDVTLEKRGGRVVMRCRYTVELEFPFYTYRWTFDHRIDRPVFII